MPGYRPMTLSEAQHALGLVQCLWAKASRHSDKLDDVILNTLPPDTDELDARLALAPRQTSQPAAFPGPHAEHHLARTPATGDAGAPSPFAAPDEPSGLAAERRRLSKAQRAANRLQTFETAPPDPRGGKGKAAGKGKPPAKGKAAGKGDGEKQGSRGEWCRSLQETGTCPFGKKCWFRHT